MSKLTKREYDIFNYIVNFKITNGYAPTITEIANGVYTSRSFVRSTIYRLEDKGYVKYNDQKRRSIVITKFL